ncbi:F-box protein At2g02240-like [Henckelia pumila]|uniref:F-box protein At2g02240-like n=1 Tax=Henckelia pumila TaxID=405737 RepID=UPI003C6E9DE0
MDPFARLPEGCISEILSLTSPPDASRSSIVSKEFKSAVESDAVWERFLPCDCPDIISKSVSPLKYATKKDLYFHLCHSPVLVDGGKMSFSLNKIDGKKCFMVGARQLLISWKGCWDFIPHSKSRFAEVAKLRSIGWIHIQGRIKARILSKNATYTAYLVFWLEKIDGLNSSNTVVRFIDNVIRKDRTANEQRVSRESGKMAKMRDDGWMEIEMGKFYNDDEDDDGEIEVWLIEINNPHEKFGLMVEGIEFRPI